MTEQSGYEIDEEEWQEYFDRFVSRMMSFEEALPEEFR